MLSLFAWTFFRVQCSVLFCEQLLLIAMCIVRSMVACQTCSESDQSQVCPGSTCQFLSECITSKRRSWTVVLTIVSPQSIDGDVSAWDVSSVTTMDRVFSNPLAKSSAPNQDFLRWSPSRVQDASCVFRVASLLDQCTSAWDISNVKAALSMFCRAFALNLAPQSKRHLRIDPRAVSTEERQRD